MRWRLIGAALVLTIAIPATANPATQHREPALEVRSLTPFSLRGTRFEPSERVRVSLNTMWVKRVRANPRGAFLVTFSRVTIGRCDGYHVDAKGSKGSSAKLRVHELMCPSVNPG